MTKKESVKKPTPKQQLKDAQRDARFWRDMYEMLRLRKSYLEEKIRIHTLIAAVCGFTAGLLAAVVIVITA